MLRRRSLGAEAWTFLGMMEGFPGEVPGPWEDHLGRRARKETIPPKGWALGAQGLRNRTHEPGPSGRMLSAASGLSINNRPHGAPTVWGRQTRDKEGTHLYGRPSSLPDRTAPPGTPGVNSSQVCLSQLGLQ